VKPETAADESVTAIEESLVADEPAASPPPSRSHAPATKPTPAFKPGDFVLHNGIELAKSSAAYALFKRATDIAIASLLLVATAPVMAGIAIAIKFTSQGPALFRQPRVGKGGGVFVFYKFRTMHFDARERFPDLYAYDEHTRTTFEEMLLKTKDDPRLTRLGRILRTTSLDELPNLINVLKGDMSLVGPRPELPEMVCQYLPRELAKFSVKPGVTGIWQVSGRGLLPNVLQLIADVEYVRRRSFWFDTWILLRTVAVVIRRVGAF
jgi:lipopolysaccharide/colanic/teichoic acid biosynthesis glycosyltransferase